MIRADLDSTGIEISRFLVDKSRSSVLLASNNCSVVGMDYLTKCGNSQVLNFHQLQQVKIGGSRLKRGRQMSQIRRASDETYAALLSYRHAEIAEAEAAAEREWAGLKALEPQINKYPDLKDLYQWMKERRQLSESGQPDDVVVQDGRTGENQSGESDP